MASERPPRTRLEQEIQQRGLTAEEFSAEAETFAREHGIGATLSARHAQRLMAGHGPHGQPLGPVRPSTRRLLEAMFGRPIAELLGPPAEAGNRPSDPKDEVARELQARLDSSSRVDRATVDLFQQKVDLTRILDRRLGGLGLLGELQELTRQLDEVLHHTLRPDIRSALARVLVDCSSLAGWQSLDHGDIRQAWQHYEHAKTAALEARSTDLEAYANAEQAVILLDMGATQYAVELTEYARSLTNPATPPALRSWLAAAHGEACAARGNRDECLRAFDHAAQLMPATPDPTQTPYIVFDRVHLTRWRGSALARIGDTEAIAVLSEALNNLDPSFARAEAALRIDLACTFTASGEKDAAAEHAQRARQIALTIGSVRQRNRLGTLPI
jgi:tetratricopeptide (TPR) repeat protein